MFKVREYVIIKGPLIDFEGSPYTGKVKVGMVGIIKHINNSKGSLPIDVYIDCLNDSFCFCESELEKPAQLFLW